MSATALPPYDYEGLAFEALQAAIQANDVLKERTTSTDAIVSFARALQSYGAEGSSGSFQLTSNPIAASLIGRSALIACDAGLINLHDVEKAVGELLSSAVDANLATNSDAVLKIRRFCLALHSELLDSLSQSNQSREQRPSKPTAAPSELELCEA